MSPLTGQQLRVQELVSGRAVFCLGLEKSFPEVAEATNGQRHEDVESHEITTALKILKDIPSGIIM